MTDRFPADVARVLVDAGWAPGRDIAAEVSTWVDAGATGIAAALFPRTRAALAEFGGLVLPQYGPGGRLGGGFTSYFHPHPDNVLLGRAAGYTEEYDVPAFPLGWNDDDAEIAMNDQGRVFFLHSADTFYLGPDLDAAVIALVRGEGWPTPDDEGWPAHRPAGPAGPQPPRPRMKA